MKKYAAGVLAGILCAISCTKSFDEVNTDPDRSLEVPLDNVLAYCERFASDNMFDEWFDLNESCGFSGQIAKWMYTEQGYYSYRPSVNNQSWEYCYRVTSNLQDIIDRADSTKENIWGAATIFQCQIWQIMTDRWQDIPYFDANKLLNGGIIQPKYDKQEAIYKDLLKRLGEAVASLGKDKAAVGNGDVLLGGNVDMWRKYGNALSLRLAARVAGVDPTLSATVFERLAGTADALKELPADNKDNIFFTTWGSEYAEPWADYYNTRKLEYGVSNLMIDTLLRLEDPRLPLYAEPIGTYKVNPSEEDKKKDGAQDTLKYQGYQVGQYNAAQTANYSAIGTRFQNKSGLTGFSPWLRSCEVYFALSYAASKGFGVAISQENAYRKAVTLSLLENEIEQQAIDAYLGGPGAYDGSLDQLFTQWWISVFKNGMEAWSLFRMSGVPAGNVIAPYYNEKVNKGAHNTPPLAYPYPDTELNLNNANCAPYAAQQVDGFWGKRMWWDVREGVH